jgi:hypothetical protein
MDRPMIMQSGVSDIIKNCTEPDIIKMVKSARLRWLGHLYRTEELNPCKKPSVSQLEKEKKEDHQ